jgi:hypothetical protein
MFQRSILILLFSCSTVCVYAQRTAFSVSVDKQKILLGEPMVLTVEVKVEAGSEPVFVRIDSIPHFEMIAVPDIDTISSSDGVSIRGIYQLTSFDSGHWVIPAFSLPGAKKTDTIPVDVIFSENFNPEQEYHDIKDIIEVKVKKKIPWWWYAAGGALILVLLLVYFLRKRKPAPTVQQKAALTAFEEAMKQLDQLKKERPASKQFHTRLGEIFRLYVFKKKGILSLQKTTDDLVLQLKNLDMEKSQYDKLVQALRLGDFVKFAKYNPTTEDDSSCFNDIGNSIINLEKTETKVPL